MHQVKCDHCGKTESVPADRTSGIHIPPGWTRFHFAHCSAEAEEASEDNHHIRAHLSIPAEPFHPVTTEAQDYCNSCIRGLMSAIAEVLKSSTKKAS